MIYISLRTAWNTGREVIIFTIKCRLCELELKEGEIVFYLYQGRISENCYIKAELPLNLVICNHCIAGLINRNAYE